MVQSLEGGIYIKKDPSFNSMKSYQGPGKDMVTKILTPNDYEIMMPTQAETVQKQ